MANEEVLYEHIRLALERDLPLIGCHFTHNGTAILVGSGPSVRDEVESIRKQQEAGNPIIAIKDAHNWLLSQGIIPDYAVAVDPQPNRWECFKLRHPDVKYMIASQCHPNMFEHLKNHKVFLWHLYIKEGQTYPPNSLLVTGGTTSGLRAITLFYSMGFRRFELYGYDSCITNGELRLDGKQPEKIIDVIVGNRRFKCDPPMAAQANEFQNLYTTMPDMIVHSNGYGLITAILEEREKQALYATR